MSTWRKERSERVDEAAVLVSMQAECSVGEALALLRAHAELWSGDLEQTAIAVLVHR